MSKESNKSPEQKSPSEGNEGRLQYMQDEVNRITGQMAGMNIKDGEAIQDSPGGISIATKNRKAKIAARKLGRTKKDLTASMTLAAPSGVDSPSTGVLSYSDGQHTQEESTRQKRSIADVGAAQKSGRSTKLGQPAIW